LVFNSTLTRMIAQTAYLFDVEDLIVT
jgi:hypothetical protein